VGLPEFSMEPLDSQKLSDKELVRFFCVNRKERALATELWRRYGDMLRESLKRLVFSRHSFCPDFIDRKTFLDSTFSRVYLNFFARICRFRELDSPRSLKAWLNRVTTSAALDENRWLTRSRTQIIELGLEEVSPEEVGAIPEETSEEEKRPFRTKLLSFYGRAQKIPPPDVEIEAEERKFVVREVLVRYNQESDENADSARLIRLRYFREWEISKIVGYVYGKPTSTRQEKTWERHIFRDMAHDYENLRALLKRDFGITVLRQV